MTDTEPFASGGESTVDPDPSGKGKEKVVSVRRNRPTEEERLASVDTPRRVPVRLAMLEIKTSTAPTVEYTVDMVVDCLRQAEKYFKSQEDYVENELRVFVGPEWFFRKPGDPYSHREMHEIVTELRGKTGTDEFQYWLVVPGTIYFGLGYDEQIGEDHMDDVAREIEAYFGLPAGDDAPDIRPDPVAPVQWFVGNLAVAICQGRIMGYHFKTFQQDIDPSRKKIDNPIELWAMEALPLAHKIILSHMPFFRLPGLGLEVALEICRDHNQMTNRFYYGAFFDGPGTHLQIVMCYGVEFRKAACVARAGGYFLRCNGTPGAHVTKVDTAAPDVDSGEIIDNWRAGAAMPAFIDSVAVRQERLGQRRAGLEQQEDVLKNRLAKKHFWQDKSELRSQLAHKTRQIAAATHLISETVAELGTKSKELKRRFEEWDRAGQETFRPKGADDSGTLGRKTKFDVDPGGRLLVWEGKMELEVGPLSQRKDRG